LYELPKLNVNKVLNTAIGGWKLGLLETAESGPTFSVITTTNTTNAFPAGPIRPNLLSNPNLASDQRTISRWFDTAAFANPAALKFGNSPRGGLRGAPVVTTDITVEKGFSITERTKLEVRAEFYNLLNHAIFNIPGFTLGGADFGVVSSARSPRNAQLSARISF
ncbi:MAG: TonB-dependent receptor, plug, partial [Bryobacterales bacterium]|nr:TonB-dependent receptor, plug [Bryobacterales bacterium]